MAGENQDANLGLPGANAVPTQETPNSVAVGYTESDPVGPQADSGDNKENLLAGEFKTPEELAAAYAELKKQLAEGKEAPAGEQNADDGDDADDDTTPKVAALEHSDEAVAELKAKGLDLKVFSREYETTGQLSDESYAALAKAGYERELVDAYIAGQQVMVESQVKAVKDSVGGEEAFGKIAQWAAANLPEAEQAAYARVLDTGNKDTILFAVQGLKARYDAANGSDPELVISGAVASGNDGKSRFKSWAEATAAMSDPRYGKDPAYRSAVEEKILRSNI